MTLRFIIGAAGSGKSHACTNEIKQRIEEGGNSPLILLVPEQYTLQGEKELVKAVGRGIIRAEVLSFRRMAYRVFNEVGGVTHKHIDPAGKCMLIYTIIEKIKDKLKTFTRSVDSSGFINNMLDMIAEFKRYNVTPEMLNQVKESLVQDDLLKDKLEDISLIFKEFEEELHKHYIDSEDDLTFLVEKLEKSKLFNDAEIWIDQFSSFTPQEYKIIECLFNKVKRINVSLCTDSLDDEEIQEAEVFCGTKRCADRIYNIAKQNNIKVEPMLRLNPNRPPRLKDSLELCHIEKNYFFFPYRAYQDQTQDVSVFACKNIYSEVEKVAKDIISNSRDNGIKFRDMAVVGRNLNSYGGLIDVIFKQYNIPYFIDQKRPITSHPLVMLILSAVDIIKDNWNYESVFRYLKTGLTNIDKKDIDLIENYVLANGIRGSRWTKNEKWNFKLHSSFGQETSEYEQALIQRVNEIRQRITPPLVDFGNNIKRKKTVKEVCTALYQFICQIEIPSKIESWIEQFKQEGELDLAKEYSQIWNMIMEILDQMVEVMGSQALSLEQFSKILSIGLEQYKIGIIPPALDQVMIGSIEHSISHQVKILYIIGVNDGVFPAASKDEGILLDNERDSLKNIGVELAPTTRSKAFEEQYLIYKSLTTPSHGLKLSYAAADSEGKSLRPSIIISRLKKIFPKLNIYSNIVEEGFSNPLEYITTPQPTFNEMLADLRRQAEGAAGHELWWDAYRWFNDNSKYNQRLKSSLEGFFYNNQLPPISETKTRKLYGSPVYSSVSRLERFASCPFSYFVQYGLKAKDRKIFKLSSPDLGSFFHNVIDRFSKVLEEKNLRWRELTKEDCDIEVSNIVDELLESMSGSVFTSSSRYIHLTDRLKRVLSRSVWVIAMHIQNSSFEPMGYEVAFGDKDIPPITLELPNGETVKLVGRIDRVDSHKTKDGDTYLRIIDYKSGNKAFKLSDIYHGLQIQLITYLDALSQSKENEKVLPGGMLYFRIEDPIIKGSRAMETEEIERQIIKALRMKGLVLADVNIIKEMDKTIEQGDSLIIPAGIKKDGGLSSRSSAATLEQFDVLRKYAKSVLSQISSEMLSGNVAIRPYKKKGFTSCGYCDYSSVCQFDPTLKENKYKVIDDKKDDEVWKLMRSTLGEGGEK